MLHSWNKIFHPFPVINLVPQCRSVLLHLGIRVAHVLTENYLLYGWRDLRKCVAYTFCKIEVGNDNVKTEQCIAGLCASCIKNFTLESREWESRKRTFKTHRREVSSVDDCSTGRASNPKLLSWTRTQKTDWLTCNKNTSFELSWICSGYGNTACMTRRLLQLHLWMAKNQ